MALELNAGAAKAALRGHPWVFREAIRAQTDGKHRKSAAPNTGDVVELACEGQFVGRGLYDAESPIAVRIYSRREREPIDGAFFAGRIERAWAKRDALFDATTTMMRVVNGEGDRAPGLVIDRYGAVLVMRLDGDAISAWTDKLARALVPLAKRRGVETILLRTVERHSGKPGPKGGAKPQREAASEPRVSTIEGRAITAPIEALEHGMRIEIDVLHGQKTGAFIDQRENRRRVRGLVRPGARVLNLFSYTGGFSLAAALGGARQVTSVDIAPKAHATAQRTFRLNGIDPTAHSFVTADAIAHLAELDRRRERFDVVISDPPSFAPNEKSKQRGLSAYAALHKACARVLAPGGTLCLASCSSHVSLEDFLGVCDDRALDRDDLTVEEAWGPPADHPTLAAFPEGRYLKFVVLR